MSKIVDLAQSPWTALLEDPGNRKILLLPLAPLEEHGPHLPLGTDLLLSEHWARDLARRLTRRYPDVSCFLYPAVPLAYGNIPVSSGLRGCFHVSAKTVEAVARDLLVAASKSGIGSAVVLSAHGDPRHQIALEKACEEVSAQGQILALSPAGALFSAGELGIDAPLGPHARAALQEAPNDFHAGWIETSMMLELDPTMVSENYPSLEPVEISSRDMANPEIVAERTQGRGWLGYPALASREAGQELLKKSGDFLERAVVALLERGDWQAYSRHFLHGKPYFS